MRQVILVSMRLLILILFIFGGFVYGQILPNLGGQRAGISALAFLKNVVSPRMAGMGGMQISLQGDAYSWSYNPATAANLTSTAFAAANTFYFAGINQFYASVIVPTRSEGAWGGFANALSSGAMKKRTEFQPDGTGEYFYASYAAAGFSYAKKLSDKFNYGMQLKYVNETLDRFVTHTVLVDMGFFYKTDFKDLQFAVVLYNFGPNSRISSKNSEINVNTENYPPPTLFSMGISFVPRQTETSRIVVGMQLNHPSDEAENLRFGAEYDYRNFLFLRLGWQLNVQDRSFPTAGVGLKSRMGKHPLKLDYAFTPHNYMGIIHRIGLSLYLNKMQRDEKTE